MRLQMAFYPLLLLKALQDEFEVVPLDLGLNPQQRILVISGPNAGGKSVSLKTVGLLQLMLQSGLLVPVDERSEFRLFDALFLQIGDEQSVESDLSTYTSHLYQLRLMGDNMNENSLFLIDEFGSGTDPKLGGAIAEAFLERFLRQGAYGIITTHYSNIKEYAETEKQIANGAMQFDTEELKPTYRLVEGLPGRSYAFEIAKRVGVHFTILRKAQRKIGRKQMTSEQLLAQLEEKNQQMEKIIRENEVKEARLNRLLSENEILQSELTRKRKQMLRDAQQEARDLIKDANKKIENTIREIRERQAERVATRRLRKSLEEATPELTEVPSAPQEKKREEHPAVKIIPGEKPEAGDYVRLKNSRSYGKLVELQGNRGVVEVGDVRLTVKLKELHKVEPPKSSKKQKQVSVNFQRSLGTARVELDVMGQRVEEALVEVEKLVDEAMLAGLTYLRILHGKGSGALREGIRNYLQDHEAVMSIKDAAIEAGGAGWTIVELKEQG
jgi:DNA mismatch repair protein MutS2